MRRALQGTPGPCRRCCFLVSHAAIKWVIVGGESGGNARPCEVAWIRSIVAQCRAARVPVFVKQLGSQPAVEGPLEEGCGEDRDIWTPDCGFLPPWVPEDMARLIGMKCRKGGDPAEWPEDLRVQEEMPRRPELQEATG
jgi:hypothetical protein